MSSTALDKTSMPFPGWWQEFVADALRQLPRPGSGPDEIDKETALKWSKNQKGLKERLSQLLLLNPLAVVRASQQFQSKMEVSRTKAAAATTRAIGTAENRQTAETVETVETKDITKLFSSMEEFSFIVPPDYNCSIELDSFRKQNSESFKECDPRISDENFAFPTYDLVPGKTYRAKILSVNAKEITSEDCLRYYHSTNAILAGPQALTMAWRQHRDKFPAHHLGYGVISFDQQESLLKLPGQRNSFTYKVPFMFHSPDGKPYFKLGSFESKWTKEFCILCLYEMN